MSTSLSSQRESARRRFDAERRPSAEHLSAVRNLAATHALGPFLPVRRAFIVGNERQPPPFSGLLHGAGLDAVQLKVFLLVMWLAAWRQDPSESNAHVPQPVGTYAVSYDLRDFAAALDLPDSRPGGKGPRRVRDAVRRLEQRLLLHAPVRSGSTSRRRTLQLLREDGSGSPYTNPAWHSTQSQEVVKEGAFIQLPNALFRNGWLSALSGAALATWLVLEESATLRRLQASSDDGSGFEGLPEAFISRRLRRERYHISDDTFLKGRAELIAHGLAFRTDKTTETTPGSYRRRETITLHRFNFKERPAQAILPEMLPGGGRKAPTTPEEWAKLPGEPEFR